MNTTTRWTAGVLMSWLAAASAGAQTSDRPDGMRFVPDVEGQFVALTERADHSGFTSMARPIRAAAGITRPSPGSTPRTARRISC